MKLFKILFLTLFLLFPQYSFAQQTNTQLLALIQSLLPTNGSNEISAADLRTVLANMVNSTNVTNTACLTASLTNYQFFADNAVPASVLIQLFDGTQCVTVGTLNTVSHTFSVAASTNNITIGTTLVSGGTNGQCLYDNAGVVGNQACSSGSGTVTSIVIGTGLSSTQSPLTSTGTLSISNTTVTPNTYGSSTSIPTFTVNQQGQLTAASGNVVIAPAGTLSGSVLANNVLTSSLTSVGTLVGGGTSAGFTVDFGSSTFTGTIPSANLPLATTSIFGAVKCDGTTISCTTGVISSIAGSGTVNSGTSGQLAYYASNGTAVSGNANVTITGGLLDLGQSGSVAGSIFLNGSTSGGAQIKVPASGTIVNFTLPNSNGTNLFFLQTDGGGNTTWAAAPGATFANPTASLGLTAVNGSATTAMRSDGAPALSQAIAPTWTAQHIFNEATTVVSATGAALDDVKVAAATTTITGTTTITALAKIGIYRPTITDASAVTITDAASLYVDNSPLAAGSVTLTNVWAIRVGAGNVSFPGTGNVLGTIISGTWNGGTIALNQGGTGQTTQQAALNALAPIPTRAGDLIYYNGTNWVNLAGNNSGTQFLQENVSGVPSWATAGGTGTVTQVNTGTFATGGPITSTGTVRVPFLAPFVAANYGAL